MQKKRYETTPRLRVGRDGDAGRAAETDLLDLTAPIAQKIELKDPDQQIRIPFAQHQEYVQRQVWVHFIEQNIEKITQADMAVRSTVLDANNRLVLAFVHPKRPMFNTLVVTPHASDANTLWTGYFSGGKALVHFIRRYLSNQRYQVFTLAMYGYLRMIADQQAQFKVVQQNGLYWLKGANQPIATDETVALKQLAQHQLIQVRQHKVVVTALGMSLLNYFARFFEQHFLTLLETGRWIDMDADFTNGMPQQHRKKIDLPDKVVTDD
ncbi:hypothetical protein JOC36_000401 [Weissella uvarum]|uniref:hypothetical protein n=1 Tax=Weissella uvarum TaxID=1479233 RepID=UPI001961C1AB|nr:hypothetical protein [Weissella uvarum]MBM7616868.1 hypothetical protein [Weissella uvarum]MCM0594680.1 hypothetical protein [Weissella uvarum]